MSSTVLYQIDAKKQHKSDINIPNPNLRFMDRKDKILGIFKRVLDLAKNIPDISNYYDMLDAHDWFHGFSDDPKLGERGRNHEAKLLEFTKLSPAHKDLFDAFKQHHFSGKHFGTMPSPKPGKPKSQKQQ